MERSGVLIVGGTCPCEGGWRLVVMDDGSTGSTGVSGSSQRGA